MNMKNEFVFWEYLALLSNDLKAKIGSFSKAVMKERAKIKVEYFRAWSQSNIPRIIQLVEQSWTKEELLFVLSKFDVPTWHFSMMLSTKERLIRDVLKNKLCLSNDIYQQLPYYSRNEAMLQRQRWQRLKLIEIVSTKFEKQRRLHKIKQRMILATH